MKIDENRWKLNEKLVKMDEKGKNRWKWMKRMEMDEQQMPNGWITDEKLMKIWWKINEPRFLKN